MVDKDRIKKLLNKVYRLNYWFCNEMLIDEQHAAEFEEACKKANESGEPVIMVSAAEGNAKCMKSCMKDTVAILNFLRKEENWEYLEPWQMDSAGIGRADLIEHIEHEKVERNEHHGE